MTIYAHFCGGGPLDGLIATMPEPRDIWRVHIPNEQRYTVWPIEVTAPVWREGWYRRENYPFDDQWGVDHFRYRWAGER